MNKGQILDEIKRTTSENGGVPLGQNRFRSETVIKESDWGKYWLRWGEALREAGFSPNAFQRKILSDEQLLEKFIALIREFNHYPTQSELRMRKRNNSDFPSGVVFSRRFGRRHELAARLVKHCLSDDGYKDVLAICQPLAVQSMEAFDSTPLKSSEPVGSVYLIKSGRCYKVGRTNAMGRREYEIGIQLPEKMKLVHSIKTDDPVGIEAYWHNRFKDQRRGGEWFTLTPQDVSAFRRRKFM